MVYALGNGVLSILVGFAYCLLFESTIWNLFTTSNKREEAIKRVNEWI